MNDHIHHGKRADFKSRATSMLLAFLMLLTSTMIVPVTAWSEPYGISMEEEILDRLDELNCIAHGKLDLQFGNHVTLTEDTLNALLTEIFGYEAEIDSYDFTQIKNQYGGAGNGDSLWYDAACITFTDPDTGGVYDAEIDLSIRKSQFAAYTGAVATGALSVCPDEWNSDIRNANAAIKDYYDGTVVVMPYDEYDLDNVEEFLRGVTGLGDDWSFFITKFDEDDGLTAAGDYVQVAFLNEDVNGEGRTYAVEFECNLRLPMGTMVEARYEELACVAHGLLDLVFGTSATIPSLPDVLTDIFGFQASMDPGDIQEIRSDYGALGDGQTAWPGEYTVTFSDPDTGEEYDIDMDFAMYKAVGGKYCGAIEDKGFLGCCPDELPAEVVAARNAIDDRHNPGCPDFWDDNDVFTIPGDEYTEVAVEAWFRGVTGLTGDDWTFFIQGFDADKAYDGNEVHIGLRNDNVNDEGRTVIITCGPTLKIAAPAGSDPMPAAIEELYEDLQCVGHGDLNLIFGTSGTITTDTLGALLTEIFGYPAEVAQSEIDYIRNEGGAYYFGHGDGQTAGAEDVEVTFTNPDLGTTYTTYFDLALYKCVTGTYCGAIVDRGYLSVCPDEWPEDLAAARDAIDDAHNPGAPDFWNSNDVFTLEGDEYTEAAVEAWYRGITGLGDNWTFFIQGFDADKAYDGNAVYIGLRNDNINDEGRTFVISCSPTLKLCSHIFSADITGPTCTEHGYTTFTCTECGYVSYGDYVDALGHDYVGEITAPTCTEKGYTTHTCSRCGDYYVDTYVSAAGHDFVNGICTVCGADDPNFASAIVEDVRAKAGEEITVDVYIENAPLLRSIAISDITLDSAAFTLLGVEWDIDDLVISSWDEANGKGVAALTEARDINGMIATLTLMVNDDTGDGEYSLDLTVMAKNENNTDVVFLTEAGTLTVYSIARGDLNEDEKVTDEDAIYLLYYTFFPETYPLNQDGDFNGDGEITDADALYLLYFTFFPELYPIA